MPHALPETRASDANGHAERDAPYATLESLASRYGATVWWRRLSMFGLSPRSPAIVSVSALVVLAFSTACTSIPEGRSAIDAVSVEGASHVEVGDIEDHLATTASPRFLGLFRGLVYEYEVYDRTALQRDLARVEHYYRARGYYDVKVRAGRVIPTKENHVRIEIVVEEGQPVVNNELAIEGVEGLPRDVVEEVTSAVRRSLPKGQPFDQDEFTGAEIDARRALTDHGYAYAKVRRDVFLDIVRRVADAKFSVTPDKPAHFGKITIVGLDPDGKEGPRPQEIPESAMQRAINIDEGELYSSSAVDQAKQALLDLEVFSAVDVVPDLPDPPPESHVVPVTVKVEPTRLRQIRLGGGIEFDEIKTDVHLTTGWEDHNLFGDLRDFTVDFKPGTVLYPTRINNLVWPNRPLLEERLRVQFKQPGFLEGRTNGFIRPEFNVYPLLVQTNPTDKDPVVGYVEFKGAVGVDRTFWKLYVNFSYNVQVEDPFAYLLGPLPPTLSGNVLVLSYPDLRVQLDLRDDHIKPHKGVLLSNDLQVAGGLFGGTARDIKVQPEVRTYVPIGRRITFATRGTLGFLFPQTYGSFVEGNPASPTHLTNPTSADVADIETMYFRGFFSGGSSSNRGFPIRGIAPYGLVPFLNPATATQQEAQHCDPGTLQADIKSNNQQAVAACLTPVGGFTLWELSNELRLNVSGPFSAALFCDMSDVAPNPGEFRFNHLHLSCGVGARYDTPVGPVRLDLAYRVPWLQVLGYPNETAVANANAEEGIPPRIFGLPIAVAFGIGEAY